MRNSSNASVGGLIIKGILLLVGIVIVVSLFQKIITIVATLLFLAFLVVVVLALVRYFGRSGRRY